MDTWYDCDECCNETVDEFEAHQASEEYREGFQSDERAGKNTLMDILRELLGNEKVWDCTDPFRDIFGNFNDQMKDKFLINLNESCTKDFKGAKELMALIE